MMLRDIIKMNTINDGTRTLFESIVVPEVLSALTDWRNATSGNGVLIGGLAVSYYARSRQTMDVDIMFLNPADIPEQVRGFKRTRPGAFQHNVTHVEIEVISPATINLPQHVANKVMDTAVNIDGVQVASPSAIVALKLHRMKRYDEGDIASMLETGRVDMSGWELTPDQMKTFQEIVERNS